MNTQSLIIHDTHGRIYTKAYNSMREAFITSLLAEEDIEYLISPFYPRGEYDLGNVEDILIGS